MSNISPPSPPSKDHSWPYPSLRSPHHWNKKTQVKTLGLVWSRKVDFRLFGSSSVPPTYHVHMEASLADFSPQAEPSVIPAKIAHMTAPAH